MDISDLAMLLSSVNADAEIEKEELEKAFTNSRSLDFNNDQKLLLYALYKQSTLGNVVIPEPDETEFVEHAKWKAWKSLENFPQNSAAAVYIYLVKRCQEDVEIVRAGGNFDSVGSSSSTLYKSEQVSWREDEKLFRGVVEGDISLLEAGLANGLDIEARNEEGLTVLIAACDRGATEIVTFLLERGANIDAVDNNGDNALAYAILCDHTDIVELLQKQGSKRLS